MALPELRICFADRAALELELTQNLKHGRAFVRDARDIEVLADCVLVVVRPDDGAELELKGQAVFVSDAPAMCGVGVELRPFDAEVVCKLEAFARGERVSGVRERPPADGANDAEPEGEQSSSDASDRGVVAAVAANAEADAAASGEDADAAADAGTDGGDAEEDGEPLLAGVDNDEDDVEDEEGATSSELQKQAPAHERMRRLSVTEQQKIARNGELNDRVALERLYGKAVWEGLLHNPKLTVPEVARIARKGTAPRPLLEQIIDNNAWIQAPMVRRALLGNPRVSHDAIIKLLRITPKHELKIIYKTTAYSQQVREAARKVLDL